VYFKGLAPSLNPECVGNISGSLGVAMGIYIIDFTGYSLRLTLAFNAAIFPRLARNTWHIRELRERYEKGKIIADVYEQVEVLEKSKISSPSMVSAFLLALRP
jgi:hypothetical protein